MYRHLPHVTGALVLALTSWLAIAAPSESPGRERGGHSRYPEQSTDGLGAGPAAPRSGVAPDAEQALASAARLAPGDYPAWASLAQARYATGGRLAVIALIRHLRERNPAQAARLAHALLSVEAARFRGQQGRGSPAPATPAMATRPG